MYTFGGDHKDNVGMRSAMAAISLALSSGFHGCKDVMYDNVASFCKILTSNPKNERFCQNKGKKKPTSIPNTKFEKWMK